MARVSSLPARPNLSYLKKLAKERLLSLRAQAPKTQLAHAQLAIAREHGFSSWRKLKSHVDAVLRSESTLAYYDNASHTAYAEHGGKFAAEYDQKTAPGGPMHDIADALRELCRDRRVLEVAAGHGRWTRYIAETCRHVLCTDGSARMIAQARELVFHEKSIPPGRVDFLKLDAFEIDRAPGSFDAAVVVNWIQHVPPERMSEFLDRLHRRLTAGSRVFVGINHFGPESRARLYRKPDALGWYDRRTRPDKSTYEIPDNEYSEKELRKMLEPYGEQFQFHSGNWFYWITYTAPGGAA